MQQTNEKLYGDKNYNNIKKREQTNLLVYGYKNAGGSPGVLKKIEETKFNRYGNKYYVNLEKGQATNLKVYGHISPLGNKEVQSKIERTNQLKYGISRPMQNPEFVRKCYESFQKNHPGVKGSVDLPEVKKKLSDLKFHHSHYSSKPENEWLDFIGIPNNKKCRQVYILGNTVDGYKQEIKTVYEFLGSYWHGSPIYFNTKMKRNPTYKLEFEKRFNHTLERFKKLFKSGYNIIYVWEHEWKNHINVNGHKFDGINIVEST